MTTLKEKLQDLKSKIEKLAEKKRNKIQLQFLQELAKTDEADQDVLFKFLKNEKLFENLTLTKEQTMVIKDIVKRFDNDKETETEAIDPKKNILYYKTTYENFTIEMFLKKPVGYTIPTEVFEFISAVEDVQTVIKENCKTNEESDTYLSALYGIAEVGGTSTYNTFAKKQLDSFEENFVASKWWSLKLPFIKELGITMLGGVVICFIIVLLLKTGLIQEGFYKKINVDEEYLTNWFFVLIGSLIGTWVSFSLFKKNKTIEEIKSLRDNIPHPLYRMVIVALVSSIFYLFFITGFFNIEIGSGDLLSTKNIGTKNYENLALLIGIFIGFSENSVGQSLRKRIESFTSKL